MSCLEALHIFQMPIIRQGLMEKNGENVTVSSLLQFVRAAFIAEIALFYHRNNLISPLAEEVRYDNVSKNHTIEAQIGRLLLRLQRLHSLRHTSVGVLQPPL